MSAERIFDEGHPLFKLENTSVLSIGVDIGSTTSHFMLHRNVMQRQSRALSSRFALVNSKRLYSSEVIRTPFAEDGTIRSGQILEWLTDSLVKSGFTADEIDNGATIITGLAARTDNADSIIRSISSKFQNMVSATAGPMLEAKMSAYGSGAVRRSRLHHSSVLSIDIGGGTTKLSFVEDGELRSSMAVNAGARLVAFDEQNLVMGVSEYGELFLKKSGIDLVPGLLLTPKDKARLAKEMIVAILDAVSSGVEDRALPGFIITSKLMVAEIDEIVVSGGVSEYLLASGVGAEHGDLGLSIIQELEALVLERFPNATLTASAQGIRSTAIGASKYTAQLSGNTIYGGDNGFLPQENVKIIPLSHAWRASSRFVDEAEDYDLVPGDVFGIYVDAAPEPTYAELRSLAEKTYEAFQWLASKNGQRVIIAIVLEDLACSIGRILEAEFASSESVVFIDGIELSEFDFLDINAQDPDTECVMVTVKSLTFTG